MNSKVLAQEVEVAKTMESAVQQLSVEELEMIAGGGSITNTL